MLRTASLFAFASASLIFAAPVFAGPDDFHPGPVIPEFGDIADVDIEMEIPDGVVLRHAFDASSGAADGELNRTLSSAARFINMHAANGVPVENIHLAVVVHGQAVSDVTTVRAEANAALVEALTAHGVRIYVCGQSAAWYDVGAEDLLPGVDMALSAMTAHALLHAEGYSVNPF